MLTDWATRDWSSEAVGQTSGGEDVYLLDINQIQSIVAEVQPNVESCRLLGDIIPLHQMEILFLEPVEKVIDDSDQSSSFEYTNGISESYWEASTSGLKGSPFEGVDGWVASSPFNRISDLSSSRT